MPSESTTPTYTLPDTPTPRGLSDRETVQVDGPGALLESVFGPAPLAAYPFFARLVYPQAGEIDAQPIVITSGGKVVLRGSEAMVMGEFFALKYTRTRLAESIEGFVDISPDSRPLRVARFHTPFPIEGRKGRYNQLDVQGLLYVKAVEQR